MERHLGLDVLAASVTFSVLNDSGKQLRRDVVETNGKALVGWEMRHSSRRREPATLARLATWL